MTISEMVFTDLLIAALLGLGFFFGWRQIKTLRTLRGQQDQAPEEASFLRRQVQRRMVCVLLMIVLAGFLIGWHFLALELKVELEQIEPAPPDQLREHPLVKTVIYYWIAALFVLFGLLSLASLDLIATARHGFRTARRMETQRRAELEEELAQYRRRRAEMN